MKTLLLGAGMAAITIAASSANADIVLNPSNDGWIAANGTPDHFGFQSTSNYITGNCPASGGCSQPGEYRDFFAFDLPMFTGTITSATLSLYNGTIVADQHATFIYELTSTPSLTFSGLGTGTEYAFSFYDTGQADLTSSFSLNAAAIADMTSGGSFTASGRVIDASFGADQPSEFVFGNTGGSTIPTLTLEGVSLTAAAPEPASWALMLIGLGGMGAALRRRRTGAVAT